MTTAPQYRQGPDAKLKGWHVLIMMLAFFGVMFTANGIFLYSAITSFPGEDVEKSYLQGLNYNATLEARREQAALGWTMRAGLVTDGTPRLRVELKDRAGAPLSALAVTAQFRRQATMAGETRLVVEPAGTTGVYEAVLPALQQGQWEVDIEARSGDGKTRFAATKTVSLP